MIFFLIYNLNYNQVKITPAEEGGENVWISKSKWQALEKRVTDLEKEVQSQPLEIISALMGIRQEEMTKSKPITRRHLRSESQSGEQA